MTSDATLDVVALASRLIQFDTVNPPGGEAPCAIFLGDLLDAAGFDVAYHELAPGRSSLVARLGGGGGKPLCLTGHLDVVPLGAAGWSVEPLAGTVQGGRLWGRGSSDMKSGIAAMTVAALAEVERLRSGAGVVLVYTAGEETGCEGVAALAGHPDLLGEAGAIVVGEPSANRPFLGHKGVLWFKAATRGVTAHGSMPEQGVNAVHAAAHAVLRLAAFEFGAAARHPVMGAPTLNVGTIRGGLNVNSVPDACEIGVDLRTVAGMSHADLLDALRAHLGPEVRLEPTVDVEAVWSDPDNAWVRRVFDAVARVTGVRPEPAAASFFTDAGYLVPAYGAPPAVILGPGEPSMAHKTDEWCELAKIHDAVAIYRDLLRGWGG